MENIEEWLKDEYLIKKRTCNEIAKELNKDPKTIWSWMKKYGIQTRSRGGESSKGSFSKGHKFGVGRVHTVDTKNKIREKCIIDGRVPYLGKDGKHWLKGIRGEKHPTWKGGLTPDRQSFYSSEIWSEVIKEVWKRDNAICQNCGEFHNTDTKRGTFHIHHIISFQIKEYRADLNNLVLLCKKCHRWVHSKKNINKKIIKNVKQS